MRILSLLTIIFLLAACNSQVAKLSPISKIANGLFISSIASQSISPNTSLTVPFQISDSRFPLTCTGSVSATSDNGILLPPGSLSISGTAPNCNLLITPGTSQTGTGNITLSVTNGTDTSTSLFPLNVSVQVPPVVLDVAGPIVMTEDEPYTFNLNYSDTNSDPAISCNITSLPLEVQTINPCSCSAGSCSVTLQGDPNYFDTGLQFIYTVTDNDGTSNTATVNYQISNVNDPPTISSIADISGISFYLRNDVPIFTISDIDSTVNCTGSVTATSSNQQMLQNNRLTLSTNGGVCEIGIQALPNTIGTTTITLTVSDGSLSATETFNYTLTGWGQVAYIKAANAGSDDRYGYEVSIDGNLLAVSAEWEDSNVTGVTNASTASANNSLANSGAVYVYSRSGNNWVQEAYIKADFPDQDDNFGASVSISRDTLAVGSPRESSALTTITNGGSTDDLSANSGAVYIFKRSSSAIWSMEKFIKPSSNMSGIYFGEAVSLKGNLLAVGVPQDSFFQSGRGSVYVYQRTGTDWNELINLTADFPDTYDAFGHSVAIDGNIVAIGVPFEDSNATTIGGSESDDSSSESGAVFIYSYDGVGFSEEAYLKAPNNGSSDRFGYALSLDNNKIAVGAHWEDSSEIGISVSPGADTNTFFDSGAVYVFKRNNSGIWSAESYIKPLHPGMYFEFGKSVALEGNTLVVGSTYDASSNWIINGTTAPTSSGGGNHGAAYVYSFNGSQWDHEAIIKPSNAGADDHFGYSVSISGDTIAASAIEEDSNTTAIINNQMAATDDLAASTGAVYIFRNNARLFEVGDIWATSSDSTITLNWHATGGTVSEYIVKYTTGITLPNPCLNTDTKVTTTTRNFTGLSANTNYNFRICSSDGSTWTNGRIVRVRTKLSGQVTEEAVPATQP